MNRVIVVKTLVSGHSVLVYILMNSTDEAYYFSTLKGKSMPKKLRPSLFLFTY